MTTPEHPAQEQPATVGTNYEQLRQAAQHEAETTPYTTQETTKLVFNSFRFSQGDPTLQGDIADYIAATEPGRLTAEGLEASREVMQQLAPKYIYEAGVHTTELDPDEVRVEVEAVYDSFAAKVSQPKSAEALSEVVEQITIMAVDRDYSHLVRKDGRPERVRGTDQTGPAAPHVSHIMRYACEGQTTGMPEYDRMFADVAAKLPGVWSRGEEFIDAEEPSVGAALREVARVYWQHYPEVRSRLKPELAHLFEGV
jgi:hypothetical protein